MATAISSGRGNSPKLTANIADHGTIYGGRGLVFDGVTDYLDCGNLGLSGSYGSISVWININASASADGIIISGCDDSSNTNALFFYYDEPGEQLAVVGDAGNKIVGGTTDINDGQWHHAVLTSDGSAYKIYLDGKEESLTVSSGANNGNWWGDISGIDLWTIGIHDRTTDIFYGSMADLKIFDATLTEAQVQELYLKPEQSAPSAVQDNLVAWYPMCEGNPDSPQSIVYDYSEKKLSSEKFGTADNDWTVSGSYVSISNGVLSYTGSGSDNDNFTYAGSTFGSFAFATGKLYKLVVTIANTTTARFKVQTTSHTVIYGSANYSVGTHTIYLNGTSSINGQGIVIRGEHSQSNFDITEYSLKEVLMGNHATTVFHEELVNNGDMSSGTTTMQLGSGTAVGFTYYNASGAAESGTIGGVSNTWKITAGSGDTSAQIRIIPNEANMVGSTIDISFKVFIPTSGGVASINSRYVKHDTNPVNYATNMQFSETNLIANSAFANTSNWTAGNSCTLSSESGGQSGNYLKVLTGVENNPEARSDAMTVVASTKYRLSFYYKDTGSSSDIPAFSIYDASNTAYIVNGQAVTSSISTSSWVLQEHEFSTPSGCTSLKVYLRHTGSSGDSSYSGFDTVSLDQLGIWHSVTGSMYYDGVNAHPISINSVSANTEVFYTDDWSAKIVGISSIGFATADSEPTIPQVPLLRYNEKMVFDGIDDECSMGLGASAFGTGDQTLSAWFNASDLTGNQVIFGAGHYNAITAYGGPALMLGNAVLHGVAGEGASTVYDNLTSGTLSVGKTYHGVFVRDATNDYYYLYVNGVLVDSYSSSINPRYNDTYDFWMMGRSGNASEKGNYFQGVVDDCSVFNTAFSATEVQELFNDGVALDATTHSKASALKGYWRNDGIISWKNRADNFASFDGTNDVITRDAINVDYKSVSFWMRPSTTATPASSSYPVMTFFSWAYSAVAIGNATSAFTNELIMIQENSGGVKKTAWIPAEGETIPSDSWTHLGFIWNGSNYDIYYNGVKKSVVANTGETDGGHVPLSTNIALRFGHGGASGGTYYNGDLSGIAIWSESLTDAQVLSIYNAGNNGDISSIQSSDLEFYYTFNPHALTDEDNNSTVQDRSGNNRDSTSVSGATVLRDGTVAGTPESIIVREGLNSNKDGLGFPFKNDDRNVLRFMGNSPKEYLSIADSDSFDVQGDFTVEFWMKQPDMGTGYQHIVNRDDTSNRNWTLYSTNGALTFTVYSGGSGTTVTTSDAFDDDNWHHVCAIVKAGTSIQIYVDKVLEKLSTSSIPTTIDNDPVVFNVGRRVDEAQYFKGLVDEVRFYNKALTAYESDGSAPEEGETATSGEVVKNYKHGKGKHKN